MTNNAVTANGETKLLIMRYKINSPIRFLHYSSFCNLVQMPAWINIMAHHSSIGEELVTSDFIWGSPTIYDYFGIEVKNLTVTTEAHGRLKFHRSFSHGAEGLTVFEELKPNYFLIESKILFQVEHCNGDGRVEVDQTIQTLLVPVIFKDNYYYICPGQENSYVYRIHHPKNLFFTSDGHEFLKSLLGKPFQENNWCYVTDIKIVMPKQSKPVTNWDQKTDYDIGLCVPYPVVSTNKVPDDNRCSVQLVRLNDNHYIKDIVLDYGESANDDVSPSRKCRRVG